MAKISVWFSGRSVPYEQSRVLGDRAGSRLSKTGVIPSLICDPCGKVSSERSPFIDSHFEQEPFDEHASDADDAAQHPHQHG